MYGSCFLAIDRRLAQLLRLAAAVVVAAAAAAAVDAATLIAHSIHSTETGQPAQPGSRRSGPPSYPNMSVDRLYYSHKGELRSRKEEHTATLVSFSSCQRNLIKTFQIEDMNALITKMDFIFS